MNKLILNIGLNLKGIKQPEHITKNVVCHMFGWGVCKSKIVEGVGDWGREETMVFEVDLDNAHIKPIKSSLALICMKLGQDAIAYKMNSVGGLVFNDNYKGERFEFNEEYFINF